MTNLLAGLDHPPDSRTQGSLARKSHEAAERICCAVLFAADSAALCIAAGVVALTEMLATGRSDIVAVSLDTMRVLGGIAGASGLFIGLALTGRYIQRVPAWSAMRVLALGSLGVILAVGAGALLHGVPPTVSPVLGVLLLFPFVAMLLAPLARTLLRRWGVWEQRLLIVGHETAASELHAALRSDPSLGYTVAGHVQPDRLFDSGGRADLSFLLARHSAHRLVFCSEGDGPALRRLIECARLQAIPFSVASHVCALPASASSAAIPGHDLVVLAYRNNLSRPVARSIKMAVDLVAAAVLLLMTMPAFILIAVLIRRDGGPVFYRHRRIGAGGRSFGCLKFRTMRVDSEHLLTAALARDPVMAEEWRLTRKCRNDPRITGVGTILRKTSLDELPQLLNILRLEMSLVGPRPIVAEEAALYGDRIADYLAARPGLTGLWQVSGRSNTTFEMRVKLDSWYVSNWSIWNDLIVLLKTVPAVMSRNGAM